MQSLNIKKYDDCNTYAGIITAFKKTLKLNSLWHCFILRCVSKVVMMQRLQDAFVAAWIYISVFSRKKLKNQTLDHTAANLLAITDNWVIYMH